jgi:hypothetical protein
MAGPSAVTPDIQGQGRSLTTPPKRPPCAKDATGSVLRTNERELAFTLKIPNSEVNLGKVHKTFIDAVFRVTNNEVTLLPSNDRTTPVPDPIREQRDFPKDDPAHKAFFRRHSNQRDTIVYHLLITSISIDELKKRLLLTLQSHNLWMTNDSLKAKEMAVIAFVWKAPTRMLHRPTFAKKINDYLSTMELNYEQQNLLKRASDEEDLPELPQVFVNIRSIKHGNTNRVETEAPAILANKPYSRLMKELVSQIPFEALGYDIVPCGMVAKIGEDNYRNALLANNDYNNCIRSIEILYLHPSHFDLTVNYNNETGKIGEWFKNSPVIIDVQPTNRSEEIGKYFVIVEDKNIAQARKEVASLLRVFQSNPEAYGNHYPRFPCIANGPLSDGATERSAESLSRKFANLKSDHPPATQKGTDDLTAWTPSRNECVFDWQGTREFPALPSAISAPTTPHSQATPSRTQVTFPDDATTQARSAYTNDIDTTVSELKTVFTESMAAQSHMLQQFIQTSQQQQQQLLATTQSQQASTNQLLQHLSSLVATLVPRVLPPTPPMPPSDPPTPSAANQPHQSENPTITAPTEPPRALKTTPKKRPAHPDHSPDRRRGTIPQDSDTNMSHSEHDSEGDANSASPMLDPDPGHPL